MSNKAYHHGDLRNALIEAGIEVINEEGEKRFSIRKVSKLCGVSEAAPYSHFKNKEELIEAMQEHVSNQLVKKMQAIIDSYRDKTAKQLLIDLGKCYVMFFIKVSLQGTTRRPERAANNKTAICAPASGSISLFCCGVSKGACPFCTRLCVAKCSVLYPPAPLL